MNGAPANPISGTRPCKLALDLPDRVQHVRERFTRLEAADAVDVLLDSNRILDRRSLAVDEVEVDAHRLERQQQIGKENRGVDVDSADRLERDFRGEIGRAAQLEQRIAFAERAIFAHVPAGLAHEPDGCGVDGLQTAGSKKSGSGVGQWVTWRRCGRVRPDLPARAA